MDPIAIHATAKTLCVRNRVITLKALDDLGHYPQLEATDQVTA